jgi:hypothetical protein
MSMFISACRVRCGKVKYHLGNAHLCPTCSLKGRNFWYCSVTCAYHDFKVHQLICGKTEQEISYMIRMLLEENEKLKAEDRELKSHVQTLEEKRGSLDVGVKQEEGADGQVQ